MDSAAISRPRASLALGGKLRAWMVLGRISNLPTVWSNCLAGCWLGGWNTPGAVLLLCLGSTLLYTGGMFLNDACDVDFDTEFRRERPIVSGALSRRAAIIAAAALLVVGVVSIARINGRSGMFAVGLTMLIVVYDWTHKRIRTGPLLMAGCRFLLYLVAASAGLAGITPRALLFAIALGIYVAGLTLLARGESRPAAVSSPSATSPSATSSGPSGSEPSGNLWLLLFAPVGSALALNHSVATVLSCLPLILCIGWAMMAGREHVGRAVGLLLAGIVLVDLIAISTTSLPMIADCLVLFGVTLLFQKYIPAT
jgi:UbiA prenyltransferase family protein